APHLSVFFFFTLPPPPRSPLFPYTTLFRSAATDRVMAAVGAALPARRLAAGDPLARHPPAPDFIRLRRVLEVEDHHDVAAIAVRSEEHTSELQSRSDLVCRLLLEKKKKKKN